MKQSARDASESDLANDSDFPEKITTIKFNQIEMNDEFNLKNLGI